MGLIRKEDIHSSCEEYICKLHSNLNLLINGDFQVWQRGTNFNISNDGKYNYTSDRWFVQTDSAGITVTSLQNNGMRVDMQQFVGTYLNVTQLLEIPYYKKLVGKDITIRVKFKNNVSNIAIGMRAFPDSSFAHTLISETKNEFTITTKVPECSTDCEKFMIYVQSKTKQILDFDYIKLEIGSVATPFISRSFAEELALCKRYYQYGAYRGVGSLYTASGYLYVPLDVNLRISPTLGTKSVAGVLRTANGHADVKTISLAGLCNNGIMLQYTHEISNPVTNTPVFWDNGKLELDAEIY